MTGKDVLRMQLDGSFNLARPSISHVRVHIGEFDVLLNALRSGAAAKPA